MSDISNDRKNTKLINVSQTDEITLVYVTKVCDLAPRNHKMAILDQSAFSIMVGMCEPTRMQSDG